MQILACQDTIQMCYNAKPILVIVKEIIKIIQWTVPLLLIFLGTLDMFKAIIKASDEKIVQEAKNNFIRRLVYGVVIFLVPFLVRLVLGLAERNIVTNGEDFSTTSWLSCWNNVDKKGSSYFQGCNDIYKK